MCILHQKANIEKQSLQIQKDRMSLCGCPLDIFPSQTSVYTVGPRNRVNKGAEKGLTHSFNHIEFSLTMLGLGPSC